MRSVPLQHVSCDPLAALRAADGLPGLSLLHSGAQAYGLGRYSILAAMPRQTFSYEAGVASIASEEVVCREEGPLFPLLERWFERTRTKSSAAYPIPFYGGAIGYLSYDAGRHLERFASNRPSAGPDARFALYDGALIFDHATGTVQATSCEGDPEAVCAGLIAAVEREPRPLVPFRAETPLRSNFTREAFEEAVRKVRGLIRAGEVYQVNLAQRFSGASAGSPLDLFLRLAAISPAPYAAYLDFGDESIISSSPERFLTLRAGEARTRPIKGTRPRGSSENESAAHEAELAASEKDRSELLMIVDLERNDLGRVCKPGSVAVENLFALERYATVIHQTAEVRGELEQGRTWLDCAKAMFPGGSITGAPKIRAMQAIDDLEPDRRGIYTGAIGYVGRDGAADFNIAIRTIRVANGRFSFHVGGGIVWDSDPESEYEETLLKARAMMRAIGGSDEG